MTVPAPELASRVGAFNHRARHAGIDPVSVRFDHGRTQPAWRDRIARLPRDVEVGELHNMLCRAVAARDGVAVDAVDAALRTAA